MGGERQLPIPLPGGELGHLPTADRWFEVASRCLLPGGDVFAGRAGTAATG